MIDERVECVEFIKNHLVAEWPRMASRLERWVIGQPALELVSMPDRRALRATAMIVDRVLQHRAHYEPHDRAIINGVNQAFQTHALLVIKES